MKNLYHFNFLVFMVFSAKIYSQVSTPSNAGSAADYVGWNAAQAFPLLVEHKGNQSINFSTNGFQRMTIRNGLGVAGGFVGIGPNFSAPTNLLHLNAARNSFSQFTNGTTGATGTDGLLVGVADGGAGTAGHAWINQQENFPIDFFTNAAQRMIIMNVNSNIV
jgi:hypothetical protein